MLVADPQLVDPHTYPGRPWPFSRLTIRYTDRYMRKGFREIQAKLDPDSVFFLGDLFDGGREWSPPGSEHDAGVDRRWRRYKQKYWFKEYRRFEHIFVDTWLEGTGKARKAERKMVAGLPGNHDLGLGNGIRLPVRKRFNIYFGDGNRIDLVGNHTFISVDTVSLSAKDQLDPETGIPKSKNASSPIWEPSDQFLHQAGATKSRAISRHLRVMNGKPEHELMDHEAIEMDDPRAHKIISEHDIDTDIPSVLLTHVPLYRAAGTPCGPLREHYPPSKPGTISNESPEKDEANAISLRQGVQYQNVLTPALSNDLVDLIGDVTHVFSGDDHDYCEVVHREYTSKGGGIKEITVKSLSWAMGVRKPGFLLVSLWNPIDAQGKALHAQKTTIQSHLCLLPDQLQIFIRYASLLAFTSVVLVIRSTRVVFGKPPRDRTSTQQHLLPMSHHSSKQQTEDRQRLSASSATSDHAFSPISDGLAARATVTGKGRNASPVNGYGYVATDGGARPKAWQEIELDGVGTRRRPGALSAVVKEVRRSFGLVGGPVLGWYIWLLWSS